MARPENAMQVFRLLDKSNCKKCGEKTCLAFSAAVYQGRRSLSQCPVLDKNKAAHLLEEKSDTGTVGSDPDALNELCKHAAGLDLKQAAVRIGGVFDGEKLTVRILGKNFSLDRSGRLISDLHVIPWVVGPFLRYVTECQGEPVRGEWISMREMIDGKERYPLFKKRCEEAMQRIADGYTDLFRDMIELFQGQEVPSVYKSDISVVLPVLPLVPILVCYWRADEGIGSSLNVFFDRSVDANLGSEAAFTLGAGLTQMFEKLSHKHGSFAEQL